MTTLVISCVLSDVTVRMAAEMGPNNLLGDPATVFGGFDPFRHSSLPRESGSLSSVLCTECSSSEDVDSEVLSAFSSPVSGGVHDFACCSVLTCLRISTAFLSLERASCRLFNGTREKSSPDFDKIASTSTIRLSLVSPS